MATAKYLLSKFLDPPFAIAIGLAAAWVRIRREEVERHNAAYTTDFRLANPGADPTPAQLAAAAPTHADTWQLLTRRLAAQEWNPRKWNWRGMAEQKERDRWGMVEPYSGQQMMKKMDRE